MELSRVRRILFDIFYSTSIFVVFCVLIALVCVTPADSVYQSWKAARIFDIIIVASVYVLTALLALLIYASRLYTNRSVLKDIPKTYLPIEKDDLPGKRVRVVIEQSLARSAVIAFLAKPRSQRVEKDSASIKGRASTIIKANLEEQDGEDPTWGQVAHPGWTSPAVSDLMANLQYEAVFKELPDLIEARAVSLAPMDALATPNPEGVAIPDANVIELLQRPSGMGMRQYFGQLIALGVIEDNDVGKSFLAIYEQARFGPEPLTETKFRALMNLFAEILRAVTPLDPNLIRRYTDEDLDPRYESSSASNFSTSGSVVHNDATATPRRLSDGSVLSNHSEEDYDGNGSPYTTPAERSVSRPQLSARYVSANSSHSLRQTRSNVSQSSRGSSRTEGSVIRLAGTGDRNDLPYVIQIPRIDTR